jgi:hypothetical protein
MVRPLYDWLLSVLTTCTSKATGFNPSENVIVVKQGVYPMLTPLKARLQSILTLNDWARINVKSSGILTIVNISERLAYNQYF